MEVVANLASVALLFLLPRAKPSALPLLPFSDFYLHRSEGTYHYRNLSCFIQATGGNSVFHSGK
jgi:hypothetical protein